jgi:hypothetical protein
MSIISDAEKYMKRYDYLMDKRERKYKEGKRLKPEEDDELQKLRPNVFTPILMMFELLHETIITNQENRQLTKRIKTQTGGTAATATAGVSPQVVDIVTTAAVIAAQQKNQQESSATDPPAAADADAANTDDDADAAEARRLSELEESLLPLLTKIIVYIEQNKKAEKKKGDDEDDEEKYPDIGTTAKNSAILVVRRIKKWWNDLISGGTSDLSSKINLKKMIPQLANNPDDMNNLTKMDEMNKLADKAADAIHDPLKKIEKILSNDVRDIASSSVEGIMNALSLIPGIGTTLQLWRLLQNVIVIMSKSVTTMADTKTVGVDLKEQAQKFQADIAKMADPAAIANAAAGKAMAQVQGSMPDPTAAQGGSNPMAALGVPNPTAALGGSNPLAALGGSNPMAALGGSNPMAALGGSNPMAALGGSNPMAALAAQGGGAPRKTNHLRSIKKYKREYKQSIREIRKTRRNILRCIKNMI